MPSHTVSHPLSPSDYSMCMSDGSFAQEQEAPTSAGSLLSLHVLSKQALSKSLPEVNKLIALSSSEHFPIT